MIHGDHVDDEGGAIRDERFQTLMTSLWKPKGIELRSTSGDERKSLQMFLNAYSSL